MKNLLKTIPKTLPNELSDTLVQTATIHTERIISKGHTAPEKGWYDLDQNLNRPNLKANFIKLLKRINNLEQVFCLRVSLHREHAHQAFFHDSGCLGKCLEADGAVGDVTQHQLCGNHIVLEQAINSLLEHGSSKLRLAPNPVP